MPLLLIILINLVTFTANAQVVIEFQSVALRELKTLPAHTQAMYKDEVGHSSRNPMLPRILRKAIENDPQNIEVSVVVADEAAINWFKQATSILEYLPPQLRDTSPEVNWVIRGQHAGDVSLIQEYWLFPFGDPRRTLERTTTRDIQWSFETIENILKRYIFLRTYGYNTVIVLDMLDGADTAELAFWVMNNINMGLIGIQSASIPVKVLFNNGVTTELQNRKANLLLNTPPTLEAHPELSQKFTNLIQKYTAQLASAEKTYMHKYHTDDCKDALK